MECVRTLKAIVYTNNDMHLEIIDGDYSNYFIYLHLVYIFLSVIAMRSSYMADCKALLSLMSDFVLTSSTNNFNNNLLFGHTHCLARKEYPRKTTCT